MEPGSAIIAERQVNVSITDHRLLPLLNELALATADSVESVLIKFTEAFQATAQEVLNSIIPKVGDTTDAAIANLFSRAVKNYNAICNETTIPLKVYAKHYLPAPFLTPDIGLVIDVKEDKTYVKTCLKVKRNNSQQESLLLDAKEQTIVDVHVNGSQLLPEQYRKTANELVIFIVPQEGEFTVEVNAIIVPKAGENVGLYKSGEWLVTQCEPQDARRIFVGIDRPDNLATMRVAIIADKDKYPVCLSNGNKGDVKELGGNRHAVMWDDPFPKPSYLFACVMGKMAVVKDVFTRMSGKNVSIELYVENGKESRTAHAIECLKKAMKFYEQAYGREYPFDNLKLVPVPNYNMGAMENQSLIIFKESVLLGDRRSAMDESLRLISHVVGHEFFHTWTGNLITVEDWSELWKEVVTDFIATQFDVHVFGMLKRIEDVTAILERTFPLADSPNSHSLIVKSYQSSHEIFDAITYVGGREIFRALSTCMELIQEGSYGQAMTLFFKENFGKAVRFTHIYDACEKTLNSYRMTLGNFDKWFEKVGTPVISVEQALNEPGNFSFIVSQSCLNPIDDNKEQGSLMIPFSFELISKQTGEVVQPKESIILNEMQHLIKCSFDSDDDVVLVLQHGFCAPVKLKFDYSVSDLEAIAIHATDAYCRWDACKQLIQKGMEGDELVIPAMNKVLKSEKVPVLIKGYLVDFPSVRTLSLQTGSCDFATLASSRKIFAQRVSEECKEVLMQLLENTPAPEVYEANSEQMEIRKLRVGCLTLLSGIDESYMDKVYEIYQRHAAILDPTSELEPHQNYDELMTMARIILQENSLRKEEVIDALYAAWGKDPAVYKDVLAFQASASTCTAADLVNKGFDPTCMMHVQAFYTTFLKNLGAYHDVEGKGYKFAADKIIELMRTNPQSAYKDLAALAFVDYRKIPAAQQALMRTEMERVRKTRGMSPEIVSLIDKLL